MYQSELIFIALMSKISRSKRIWLFLKVSKNQKIVYNELYYWKKLAILFMLPIDFSWPSSSPIKYDVGILITTRWSSWENFMSSNIVVIIEIKLMKQMIRYGSQSSRLPSDITFFWFPVRDVSTASIVQNHSVNVARFFMPLTCITP